MKEEIRQNIQEMKWQKFKKEFWERNCLPLQNGD